MNVLLFLKIQINTDGFLIYWEMLFDTDYWIL